MEAKKISPATKSAQKRFFKALNDLIDKDKVGGISTFCREYGLLKAKYIKLRQAYSDPPIESHYKIVDFDAFVYLVRDYNVSPTWLLLGKGNMYE